MTRTSPHEEPDIAALSAPTPSARLKTALRAGSAPSPRFIEPLVRRSAVEPDFFVREMVTWALIQHDHRRVVDRLLAELTSDVAQGRAQALHTLSKIGDPEVWPAISDDLLADPDTEVARAAWRVAVGVVPTGHERELAERLATQWGRGDRDVRLSFSRAVLALGDAAVPIIAQAVASEDEAVRSHALATKQLAEDPDAAISGALEDAKRVHALRDAPGTEA